MLGFRIRERGEVTGDDFVQRSRGDILNWATTTFVA